MQDSKIKILKSIAYNEPTNEYQFNYLTEHTEIYNNEYSAMDRLYEEGFDSELVNEIMLGLCRDGIWE